jgi:DNA-binding transcriptional ArsR family regulator
MPPTGRHHPRFPEFRFLCIVYGVLNLAQDIEVLARFGRALADPIRCRLLLALRAAPAYPSDLADAIGISRTRLSNHLACLRDCGLVVAVPEGRRTRYELADPRLGHALDDLRQAVVAVAEDSTCPDAGEKGCC